MLQKGLTLTIWQPLHERGYSMPLPDRPLLNRSFLNRSFTLTFILTLSLSYACAQSKSHPWSNASRSPDERAAMVVKAMTLDEKILLLHGTGMRGLSPMSPLVVHSNGGAGYTSGITRSHHQAEAERRPDVIEQSVCQFRHYKGYTGSPSL